MYDVFECAVGFLGCEVFERNSIVMLKQKFKWKSCQGCVLLKKKQIKHTQVVRQNKKLSDLLDFFVFYRYF